MDDELLTLRNNIANLSDEELERIVTVEARDYRPEAIEFARRELQRRGITPEEEAAESNSSAQGRTAPRGADEDDDEGAVQTQQPDGNSCPFCNGPVRRAALLGDEEVIALFRDNEEERYVDLLVCTRCGEARLVVDLRSPVTDE